MLRKANSNMESSSQIVRLPKKKKVFFLLILLYSIFCSTLFNYFIIDTSSRIFPLISKQTTYYLVIVQVFFAILQATISDLFCRRKSLITSLLATGFCLFLYLLTVKLSSGFLLVVTVIFLGVLGNVVPIAWAALADISSLRSFRFTLTLSIFSIAVGAYGALIVEPILSFKTFFVVNLISLSVGIFGSFFFKDIKADLKNKRSVKIMKGLWNEIVHLKVLLSRPLNLLAFASFFFSEVAFYQIFFRVEALHNNYSLNSAVPYTVAIGYSIGSWIMKIVHTNERQVAFHGIAFIIISMLLTSIFAISNILTATLFAILFTTLNIGVAIFTPSIFALISPVNQPHEQGKIFGLLDSVESCATLLSFAFIFLLRNIQIQPIFFVSLGFWILSALFLLFLSKGHYEWHSKQSK